MNSGTDTQRMVVEIWSDVVCPWCYIGKRRFERGLAAFAHRDEVDVVYRSYQLDPMAAQREPRTSIERLASKYRVSPDQARAMLDNVAKNAAGEGLEFRQAEAHSGNTFDAHRVLHLAAERGLADAVWERFYRAYFTELDSVFDHPALVRLAAEAGLDPAEVQRVLDEGAYGNAVEADRDEASALGANGVPFYVIDRRFGVSGAQAAEIFTQALTQAWAARQPISQIVPVASGESDGVCSDESCGIPTADVGDSQTASPRGS